MLSLLREKKKYSVYLKRETERGGKKEGRENRHDTFNTW